MSRDDEQLTADERRVRESLGRLPPVGADPAFRERLRRRFVSGGIGPARSPRRWIAAALAASLAAAIGASLAVGNRGATWKVTATSGAGVVTIDGRPFDLARVPDVTVAAGARVTTDAQAELLIQSADTMTLVVTPATTVRLPATPGRWFGRRVGATLERGELRGLTGRRFAGATLDIVVPDARVEISGTTFAVFRNEEGSCACVLDGTVAMHDRTGSFRVAPGRRRVVPPGGVPPRDEPIRSMEAMKLEMLRDQIDPGRASGASR